jgi:hypothetical protein
MIGNKMLMRSVLITRIAPAVGLMLLLLGGCKHEPDVIPRDPFDGNGGGNGGNGGGNPVDPCDPDIVYFQQQILPIFIAHCAVCHGGPDPEDDLDLTSYAGVMDPSSDVVRPYDLNRKLFRAITDDDEDDRMPLGLPPLSPGDIDLIAGWIMQGAQNTSCVGLECDTMNVTYSNTIVPLIQSRCINCHSGPAPTSGLDLTSWSVLNDLASTGRLAGAIQRQAPFVSMPPYGPMLPDCEIQQFLLWIDDGAPNN